MPLVLAESQDMQFIPFDLLISMPILRASSILNPWPHSLTDLVPWARRVLSAGVSRKNWFSAFVGLNGPPQSELLDVIERKPGIPARDLRDVGRSIFELMQRGELLPTFSLD